jgi:multidrug transporter EmrE-like cation transporter
MTELWAMLLVIVACLVGSFGPILMKKGMNVHRPSGLFAQALALAMNWRIILGVAVYVFSILLFLPALRGGDLSVIYPLAASQYIWVSVWTVLFLKERMTPLKILAVVLIIAGISVIGYAG